MTTFKFKTKKEFKILVGSDHTMLERQANITMEHWEREGWAFQDLRIAIHNNNIIMVLIFSKDEFEEKEKQD